MIGEKLEIIKSIDAGSSYTFKAEKWGTCIAQLTVANIEKDASKVKVFNKSTELGLRKAKSLAKCCVCMCIVIVLCWICE